MAAGLEVADIFPRHGEKYRQAHDTHLGRVVRRVMGAVEMCRTARLGGHVRADRGSDLEIASSVETRQGAGPRHIAFSSNGAFAYVINELDSTVVAYSYDGNAGTLKPLQVLPGLPPDFVGNNRATAIFISADGRSLYASNRGHNSIVHFKVDANSGYLSEPRWYEAAGKGPRFATLSPMGTTLFVANELTDNVVALSRDLDGSLAPTNSEIRTGSPVSILFV